MKRLRLRKIWVVLAVLLLMAPLFRGSLEKTEATAGTQTTAGSGDSVASILTIKFITKEGDAGGGTENIIADDGITVPQFEFPTISGSNTMFDYMLPARIIAQIYIGDDPVEEADLADYTIDWQYSVDGVTWLTTGGVSQAQTGGVVGIDPKLSESNNVKKVYLASPGKAGVNLFYIKVILENRTTGVKTEIPRALMIKVPLQIYHKEVLNYKPYGTINSGGAIDILTNKTDSSRVYWYFYDSATDEYIKLEDPKNVAFDDIRNTTSKLVSSVGTATQVTGNTGGETYRYTVQGGDKGGACRIVGRIFLGDNPNQTDSSYYVEAAFDLFINPTVTSNAYTLNYGDELYFNRISNDTGNSLEWYLDGHGGQNDRTMPEVVRLDNNNGNGKVIGRYYGTETLWVTPIPRYKGGDQWNTNLSGSVEEKSITFTTEFDILKGENQNYRERAEDIEVLDVDGSITLTTNINTSGQGYTYTWEYKDGNVWKPFVQGANGYVSCTAINGTGGSYTGLILTGDKAGTLDVRCSVTGGNISVQDTVTLKVVDRLTLTESYRTIEVGSSFEIVADTSDATGTIVWSSANTDYVTVHPVGEPNGEPVGRRMEITGIATTGEDYIVVTATQVSSGRTATCKVKVVEVLSPVTIEGDTVLVTQSTGDLRLVFEGTPPNYSSKDIEWIVKDKNGLDADTLIKVKQEPLIPTEARVTSFEVVGEAYVAVVLNEVRGESQVKTELAVVTIKVVSPPTGLTLNVPGDRIIGYMDEGSYNIEATIEPEGFIDSEGLEIEWFSANELVVMPELTSDDGTTATIKYLAPGEAEITARIKGTPVLKTVKFEIRERVTGITLDPDDGLTLKEGMTGKITATITPATATERKLTWTSLNPEVATVDDSGNVTAVKAGVTSIIVRSQDGIEAQCPVTVLTPASGIDLNYTNITVKKGTIFYLSAKVTPNDAYDKSVTLTSSDDTIATVDADGTVTTLKVGVVEILVTSNDNPELTATCTVTVIESVSGLTLNSREETIKVGEQFLLKATVRPSDAVNTAVTFESADPSIATVDENGLITGVKGGVTVIIVKTVERGLMASCTITVQEDITSITLSETETYVGKGKDKKITATILPTSATKKKLLWTSSDESIVIVDHEGNIHGVNLGTAIITATAQDDGKISATCKVTVVDETTEIILNQSIIRIMQNDTYQLTYTIKPDYASVKRVNWSTSDASVARVDSLGLVTGVGEGEAKIRATAADGSGVYAECTVIVKPLIPVTSVTVNTSSTTMIVGDSRTLTARVLPRSTTEGLRWVSDDTSVVRIDNDGNATAVGPGVCHVTAISSVTGLEGSCTITVLGMNASTVTLEQYDTFDLYLDGVTEGVTWFSRNKRVATVSKKGVVTARREGTTDVVARVNGKMVSCEINVEKLKK